MTHSMTAFARLQKQLDASILCWEIKSVNHRYLDLSFRLPESFRFLETSLRTLMRDKVGRGKLECQLKFQDLSAENQAMVVNEGLVNALLVVGDELAANKQLANDLTLSKILSWPGVVQASQTDIDSLAKEAESLFKQTLEQLLLTRKAEGQALKNHILERLTRLNEEIIKAKQQVLSLAGQTRDKLLTRLSLLQMEIDNSRLEQEIALILARLDVSEELDRLQTHAIEVARVLQGSEAVGRRLDFLMQELNREANTLSSKSDSVTLTQTAVEMKVLIEQMREQIQNIE